MGSKVSLGFWTVILLASSLAYLAVCSSPDRQSKPETEAERMYNSGVAALARGDLDEAKLAFQESLQFGSVRIEALLGLSQVALRLGEAGAAEGHLQEAMALAPRSAKVQTAWGRYLFFRQEFQAAEAAFKRAIELDPKSVAPHIFLGNLYLTGLRQPQAAIAAYQAGLTLNSSHAGARFGLGSALAAAGDIEQAKTELEEAIRLAPTSPLPLAVLGGLYAAEKNYDQALEVFAAALDAQPKFAQAHLARGDVFVAKGEDGKALAEYEAALQIAPKLGAAYTKIGLVHEQNQRVAEAEQAYRAAIEMDPRQVIAYNNLAYRAAERKTQLDEALAWAQKAVELAPKVASFQDTLGWVHWARGELDTAAAVLEKAAALKPQGPVIFYHLGVVYAETGQAREAAEALGRALTLKKDFAGAEDARRRLAALGQSPSE